jgi:hypothetical protein
MVGTVISFVDCTFDDHILDGKSYGLRSAGGVGVYANGLVTNATWDFEGCSFSATWLFSSAEKDAKGGGFHLALECDGVDLIVHVVNCSSIDHTLSSP